MPVSLAKAVVHADGAIKLKEIVVDRFFEIKEEAMAWTSAHPHFMTLQIVRPGSHAEPSDL